MPAVRKSPTIDVPLEEVIARLRQHRAVDGVILVGSTSRAELNPASDYDLVLILSEMPIAVHVGVTNIDHRYADVVFHTTEQLDAFLAAREPLDFSSWAGRLVGWLIDGTIVFDRSGRLQEAAKKAKGSEWLLLSGSEHGVKAWIGVNFNLQVLRRYLSSADPLYLETADLRMMIYGPSDLFFNYFDARKLRWNGEKPAIQYLQAHDPEFLVLFKQFLAANDRSRKFALYEALAEQAIAPVGGLWRKTDTVMMVSAEEVTPEMETKALDFWEELVGR